MGSKKSKRAGLWESQSGIQGWSWLKSPKTNTLADGLIERHSSC